MAKPNELREKGLRLTPQRELVLQAVRQLGHATPEEVAEKFVQPILELIFQLFIETLKH